MSNKRKKSQLQAKLAAKRTKLEQARLQTLREEGRLANGLELPRGAIAADLSKQAPNNSYDRKLYYVDCPFTCVDCGKEEVWTAAQQKWYYEVVKGSIHGRAVRCRGCRRKLRDANSQERERSNQAQARRRQHGK